MYKDNIFFGKHGGLALKLCGLIPRVTTDKKDNIFFGKHGGLALKLCGLIPRVTTDRNESVDASY